MYIRVMLQMWDLENSGLGRGNEKKMKNSSHVRTNDVKLF